MCASKTMFTIVASICDFDMCVE
ncbi:hypothetical protein F383_25696 [Gossypium arboreum]|uniref:Uncharacterized protein n=1 Tax=Gossypium arboreum TaxID=29729 RepID=A0A0B0N689_GOSAR|nr:hypothetical protein F383_35327 [Gossypium arboreum]KHG20591.1 hypothetical protein F383_25696 [Gossypium arboreum]